MQKLIDILKSIREDVDYEACDNLIEGGIFDSFEIIQSIMEIEDAYEISIDPEYITPENFSSAKNIMEMINKIKNEK